MKVLLFSNDLMPFGDLPTSGGGLRCFQLMKGLEAHGIEVVVSMPGFTYLAEKHFDAIPQPQRDLLWRWETQDEIYRKVKPDAVLFASNWDHFGLHGTLEVPLIIDLHGSRLIETSMWNQPVSTDRKVEIFSKADCLLTAGQRQRSYFYGWLLQAGRVPEDEHFIRYIPVSLGPNPPQHRYPQRGETNAPHFVSGGGWFPWQNQAQAIFTICEEIAKRDQGLIEIFGTPHETQNLSVEEKKIREIYAEVKRIAETSTRVRAGGYVGRDALLEIYGNASVAVEVMQYNLERELAFTTRTVEYLWCGLPVLYNDFSELADHIKEYDAGWTINPTDPQAIRRAIEEIFSSPETVARKGANAQRLVEDRFRWDKTILPLVEFLKKPKKMPKAFPAIGPVASQASFLNPRGTVVEVPVQAGGPYIEQAFTVPAENIAAIEVAYSRLREVTTGMLELRIRTTGSKRVAQRTIPLHTLKVYGKCAISFPIWRRPRGGQEYVLGVRIPDKSLGDSAVISVAALLEERYPLQSRASAPLQGKTALGDAVDAKVLSLSFVVGSGRYYRIKSLVERAAWMVKNGEYKRLVRAARRRLPGLVHRVLRMA